MDSAALTEIRASLDNARAARRKALIVASDLDFVAGEPTATDADRLVAKTALILAEAIVDVVHLAEHEAAYLATDNASFLQEASQDERELAEKDARAAALHSDHPALAPLKSFRAVADTAREITRSQVCRQQRQITADPILRRVYVLLPAPVVLLGADGPLATALRDVCGDDAVLDLRESGPDRLVFRPACG